MNPVVASFLVGALLGSIPMAWVLVRLHTRKDLASSGSSKVGALNALRVSRSKWVGVLVLALDALKGAGAVWLGGWLADSMGADLLSMQGAGAIGAIAGHNYNPWLSLAAGRLVGGKGFAAAAGAMLAFLPWLVPVWLGLGLLAWLFFRAWRGITDEAPATACAMLGVIPIAGLIYGAQATIIAGCMAALVLPRLAREMRNQLSTRASGP